MTASSVAVFFPAHDEEKNIGPVVKDAVTHLSSRQAPFEIFIINDGSTDKTAEVAEQLAQEYPHHVHVVHHPKNLNYGGALRSGFRAALASGCEWIGFCDSDGQFSLADSSELLHVAETIEADVAVGYRLARADNLKRRLMGSGWNKLAGLVLDYRSTDVDCGYKFFRRDVVADLLPVLIGNHATISPELFARCHRRGYRLFEHGVNHYPRAHGTQSGAKLGVVIRSILQLLVLRRAIRKGA